MYSPQQEIFTLCRQKAVEVIGESNTYDYIPPKGTNYPFIFIGEAFSQDEDNKSAVFVKYNKLYTFTTMIIKKRNNCKVNTGLKHKLGRSQRHLIFYIYFEYYRSNIA